MTHLSQLIGMGKEGDGEEWLDRSQVSRLTGVTPDAVQRAAKTAMARGYMMIRLGEKSFKTQKKGQGFIYKLLP